MNKKTIEKLSDPRLTEKMKKEVDKITKELYLKDLKYAADILDIPIDEDGNTICTVNEQVRFLALMYGILNIQEYKLKNAKNRILADIIKMNSKVGKDLSDLKLSWEE